MINGGRLFSHHGEIIRNPCKVNGIFFIMQHKQQLAYHLCGFYGNQKALQSLTLLLLTVNTKWIYSYSA